MQKKSIAVVVILLITVVGLSGCTSTQTTETFLRFYPSTSSINLTVSITNGQVTISPGNIGKLRPLLFEMHGKHYWTIGRPTAKAWSIGKQLKNE